MALKYWAGGLALAAIVVVAGLAKRQATHPDGDAGHVRTNEKAPSRMSALRGWPEPASGTLMLGDVMPTGAERNRLRLRLPAGAGGACELTVEAPDQNGHALVWKPRLGEHWIAGQLVETPAGTQDWELSTDDGRRQYFYGIDVATHLHCDGAPRWHSAEHDSDTPWVVDIGHVLGHRPDPAMPADRFFERMRFLSSRGLPLRPMRHDRRINPSEADAIREMRESRLDHYMTPDGRIRFWGRVHRIRWVELSGTPIDRRWHDRLESYQ
ncbi:hypothetical protein [Salinicola tamaricis]|uniref:hypothetical protein n=1 Tax=Salinicola tamaricis TaxID=1771309 RepID=UPI00101AD241|nr:hypothetical protein [Salinicola tamaricis]